MFRAFTVTHNNLSGGKERNPGEVNKIIGSGSWTIVLKAWKKKTRKVKNV